MSRPPLNLRSIDLNLLTVFDAVMQEGNLTRAAARIGMSQPAVSDAVARLRHLLRDELFLRTHRGVRATPRAREYAPQVRRILDLVTLMVSEREGFEVDATDRRFHVVLGDYGEIVILPALLQFLAARESAIGFDVRSQHTPGLVEALSDGTLDCVLTPEPLVGEGIMNSLIADDTLVTMVRRDHPLVRDHLTLEQFIALRHVIFDRQDQRGFFIDQQLRARGLARECPVRVHTVLDMPRIAASTDLACTVPARVARQFSGLEPLKSFPTPLPEVRVQLFFNWHQRFDRDPGIAWLRGVIGNLSSSR
ncbi:LysR family transcriptional regulator [Pseudohaliea rubra]|uniref:LysR-family transcriptional regulator n=1 Tax=Pseudohaliea rubra DSM 19751 TaxID=1265313 RepID=A0A095VMQ3_9GAMM|nr:LysR family transcriptional regulator [Pseudohaliea rubra]KGE02640.1 LysR-family transcriptional regulator [Pseudohaliea rubra DSM 19751]